MKKRILFLVLLSCSIILNTFSQTGPPWVKSSVPYNYIFRGIDFPGGQNSIGFMAGESLTYSGDGIVIKTTDGGTTWSQVWTGSHQGIEGSCFLDVNNGYIAGWPSGGWNGVGKTTNGGTTWTPLTVTSNVYYFTDIVFKDASNGIVLGSTNSSPGVWKTSNGGTTWTAASGISGVPYHACHVSGDIYFLVDNSGNIKKSVDNGATWSTVFNIPGLMLLGIDNFGTDTIFACGDYGFLVKSFDGGSTWTTQQVGSDLWHDFGWENGNVVFSCGTPELVIQSNDGGSSWINGFPGSAHNAALYDCIFRSDGTGFICGSQGTILKRAPSCNAAFTATPTSVCTGGTVNFTSQSTGSNLTYQWIFEEGTPSTSNLPDPVVNYYLAGNFDVTLIVSNSGWSDTLFMPGYITVTDPPPAPVISVNDFVLTSSSPSGNQWYFNGNPVTGATNQTYTATQSGWYWDVVTINTCNSDTSNNIYILMTGNNEEKEPDLYVGPVPCDGILNVNFTGSGQSWEISIRNLSGSKIFTGKIIPGSNNQVDLRQQPPGVYLVELNSGNRKIIRKVVLQ